jgi:hypothetical protein
LAHSGALVSALQAQSASARGTWATRVSALHAQSASALGTNWAVPASALQAQSASAAFGVKDGLSTPQAIPTAATNLSNVIITVFPADGRAPLRPPGQGSETIRPLAWWYLSLRACIGERGQIPTWGHAIENWPLKKPGPGRRKGKQRGLAFGWGCRIFGACFGSERSSVW